MTIRKVRKCYSSGWCVEAEVAGVITDWTCTTQADAGRLYHLLKALRHKRKAGLL
jgi:hypothetical protein